MEIMKLVDNTVLTVQVSDRSPQFAPVDGLERVAGVDYLGWPPSSAPVAFFFYDHVIGMLILSLIVFNRSPARL
jgi:hypothetical protein